MNKELIGNKLRRGMVSAWIHIVVVALALSVAGAARAQSKGDVAVSLVAQKVSVGADGKEVLRAADRAVPGEVVQYDAHYKNQSRGAVSNLEPTLPIPAGLDFVGDSARPAPTMASLDGRTFEAFPIMRRVSMPDGTVQEKPVPFSEYRALRWSMGDLPAGKSVTVTARARLKSNAVASR